MAIRDGYNKEGKYIDPPAQDLSELELRYLHGDR